MKKGILAVTVVLALTISGLAFSQMEKGKEMMDDKGMGMMGDKEMGMMGKDMMKGDMMDKGSMMGMKMHGMMKMMEKEVVATTDGGIVILSANKITKYDKDLNLVKEIELKMPTMDEMQKMCPMMGKGGMMGGMKETSSKAEETKKADEEQMTEEEKAEHESHH